VIADIVKMMRDDAAGGTTHSPYAPVTTTVSSACVTWAKSKPAVQA